MKKWMVIVITILLLLSTTSSVFACCGQPGEPTCTPKPPTATKVVTKVATTAVTPTHVPPTLTPVPPTVVPPTDVPPTTVPPTDPPKKHKTPTQPYVYPTSTPTVVENCISECEFRLTVIDLLRRILVELQVLNSK